MNISAPIVATTTIHLIGKFATVKTTTNNPNLGAKTMNKLIPTIVFVSLIGTTHAAQKDREIFHDCLYQGIDINYCVNAIQNYHNETTPYGTTIFRGNMDRRFRPQIEETPSGVTIFRGR